ncbi:MAG: hypothetical protein OEY38_15785 [Gammaproteobacteria bacterium]|nr:hypothetical protein [Gammaproteobacteria bacterium]
MNQGYRLFVYVTLGLLLLGCARAAWEASQVNNNKENNQATLQRPPASPLAHPSVKVFPEIKPRPYSKATSFFFADDGIHGRELWKTQGTTATTTLVRDIRTISHSNPEHFTFAGNKLFFRADDGIHGQELWVSENNQTRMVADLNPRPNVGSRPGHVFAPLNDYVFFTAETFYPSANSTPQRQLYRSNGSSSGTKLVAGIADQLSDISIYKHQTTQNHIAFLATHAETGKGLWLANLDGIEKIADGSIWWVYGFNNGFIFVTHQDDLTANLSFYDPNNKTLSLIQQFSSETKIFVGYFAVNFQDHMYFELDTSAGGEFWRTDGKRAERVTLINASGKAQIYYTIEKNGQLYFSANDGIHGDEPWISNGTADGTKMIADISPDSADTNFIGLRDIGDSVYLMYRSNEEITVKIDSTTLEIDATEFNEVAHATHYQDADFFLAHDTSIGMGLYKQINKQAQLVKLIYPKTQNSGVWIGARLWVMNNRLYFGASDPVNGYELWQSDGTENGTHMVTNIGPGIRSGFVNNGDGLAPSGDRFYFKANDGIYGDELWVTDGSAENTFMLKDINSQLNPEGSRGSYIYHLNNTAYFVAAEEKLDHSLFFTDGTSEGTGKLLDTFLYDPYFHLVNERFVFDYFTPEAGKEMFANSGLDNTVELLEDIDQSGWLSAQWIARTNQQLLFHNFKNFVWRSDGSTNGTWSIPLSDSLVNQKFSFFPVADKVLFKGEVIANQASLYQFDRFGTATPLIDNQAISDGMVHDGYYFFTFFNGNTYSLWQTDGTPERTNEFLSDNALDYGFPTIAYRNKDWLWYEARNEDTEVATIYRYDGNSHQQVDNAIESLPITHSITLNGVVFFQFDEEAAAPFSSEIWKMDHDGEVSLFMRIPGGDIDSRPRQLKIGDGYFLFTADHSAIGRELWVSDGSVEGTHLLKDIRQGNESSNVDFGEQEPNRAT